MTNETQDETIDPKDIEASGFVAIDYHNDDVDTDRGVWRQRSFEILFKTHAIQLNEDDFSGLIEAMKKYVDGARSQEKMDQDHEKADQNLSKISNPNPKHKRIAKEISKMLEDQK